MGVACKNGADSPPIYQPKRRFERRIETQICDLNLDEPRLGFADGSSCWSSPAFPRACSRRVRSKAVVARVTRSRRVAHSSKRVAVVGLGPIGRKVVQALDQGIDGLSLAAISVPDISKHSDFLAKLKRPHAILPIEDLSEAADIVIECAPSKLVRSIVIPFVSRGKTAIVLSVGALLENDDLIELAKRNGGQI